MTAKLVIDVSDPESFFDWFIEHIEGVRGVTWAHLEAAIKSAPVPVQAIFARLLMHMVISSVSRIVGANQTTADLAVAIGELRSGKLAALSAGSSSADSARTARSARRASRKP